MSNRSGMAALDNRLLSHRLRGFSDEDSSKAGLIAALKTAVTHIEVDVRLTADKQIIVHHDPFIRLGDGRTIKVSELEIAQIAGHEGARHILLLSEFLELFLENSTPGRNVRVHIDVKYAGFESETLALIKNYLSHGQFVVVSWVPEFLIKLLQLDPEVTVCFSHISLQKFSSLYWPARLLVNNMTKHFLARMVQRFDPELAENIRSLDIRYRLLAGENAAINSDLNVGFVTRGDLSEALFAEIASRGGYVCLPKICLGRRVIANYHRKGLKIAAFSYLSRSQITMTEDRFPLDLYYVDNASLFY